MFDYIKADLYMCLCIDVYVFYLWFPLIYQEMFDFLTDFCFA